MSASPDMMSSISLMMRSFSAIKEVTLNTRSLALSRVAFRNTAILGTAWGGGGGRFNDTGLVSKTQITPFIGANWQYLNGRKWCVIIFWSVF